MTAATLDPRLSWLNPPPFSEQNAGALTVRTAAATDFWRKPHKGIEADNGHFLRMRAAARFRMITTVRLRPVHQYDQAGLMVRVSPTCWLKTSLEFEQTGPAKLGAVVTNSGCSDWSTQDADPRIDRVSLRVDFDAGDCTVFADTANNGSWMQIRAARLLDYASEPEAGLYLCSPKGAGFEATFERFEITGL